MFVHTDEEDGWRVECDGRVMRVYGPHLLGRIGPRGFDLYNTSRKARCPHGVVDWECFVYAMKRIYDIDLSPFKRELTWL